MSQARVKKRSATAAVDVESKTSAKCIVCSNQLGDSHQPVFDEVGKELNLQKLLWQCFNLTVVEENGKNRAVCGACLDDLIEAYDLQEKEIEEKIDAGEGPSGVSSELIKQVVDEVEYEVEEADEEEALSDVEEQKSQPDFLDDETNTQFDEAEEDSELDDEPSKLMETKSESALNVGAKEGDEIYENVDYLDEFDQNFDFRAYKLLILNSKYEDIVFPENLNCLLCSEEFGRHTELIEHTNHAHCIEDFAYPCVLGSDCEPLSNLDDLTYHLVFNHYDLNSLSIYIQCPSCCKRFSNFPLFNKHSCRNVSSVSRTTTQCEECGKLFQSNKRYRFHLQFHLVDHRPMACFLCDKMFSDVNEFFEHVSYDHETDNGLTCTRCDRVFTSEENLNSHKKVHKLERPYRCGLCPRSYLYSQLLKDHVVGHHSTNIKFQCHICGKHLFKQTLLNKHIMLHKQPEEKSVYSCSECGFVGENEEDTELHIKNDHSEVSTDIYIEMVSIDIAFCCEYCELAYRNAESLQQHRDLHEKKEFHCNLCPSLYDEYKKLKTHKITHIEYVDKRKTFPVMRHYMCDVEDCTQSYMQWTTLRSHKRNKHSSKEVYQCKKCSEEFFSPMRFNQHMQAVHGGAIHECQFCDKSYISKMAIAVHIARKHNSLAKIQCDECSSAFSNEAYLKRHKAAVHCPLKCDECGKVLKNLKNFQVHQRMVHEKEKRYFCRYCEKGYYNQCDCVEHEETVHQKLKRYHCDKCDYKAIYKQTLTIHMRAHNNETPYKCTICPKAFRRAYALSLHLRRHYNIRNFVCPFEGCGSAYPNQGILNSHLRKKHPNGLNTKSRKRKTISIIPNAVTADDEDEEDEDQNVENKNKIRRKFDVPLSNVFVDDDDGLDDGVIGEPQSMQQMQIEEVIEEAEEDADNLDEQVAYIIGEIVDAPAVIVQHNESDHDYIVRPDDNKIYGNVIEEYIVADDGIIDM